MLLPSRILVVASVLVAVGNAFPTAENFGKLLRPTKSSTLPPVGGDAADHFQDIHRELLRLREKRLLVDLSGDPIDGM